MDALYVPTAHGVHPACASPVAPGKQTHSEIEEALTVAVVELGGQVRQKLPVALYQLPYPQFQATVVGSHASKANKQITCSRFPACKRGKETCVRAGGGV